MTTKLIDTINIISTLKYIKKPEKTFIIEQLEVIKDTVDDKESPFIKTLIKLMSGSEYKAAEKNKLNELKEPLIKIINKYEEHFNNKNNDDTIDDNVTIEDVSALLDAKISSYKFSEHNPMEHVIKN